MKVLEIVQQHLERNQFGLTRNEIEMWLHEHYIQQYQILSNLTVNIKGHFSPKNVQGRIPMKFNHVSGLFSVPNNSLTTFDFLPMSSHSIYIQNNNITSFHNIHKVVEYCQYKIEFRQQGESEPWDKNGNYIQRPCPTHLLGFCAIKGLRKIESGYHQIDDLFVKHKGDMLTFQQALIDAGFPNQAKL